MSKTDYTHLIGSKNDYFEVVDVVDVTGKRKKGVSCTMLKCKCRCGNTTLLFPYQFQNGSIMSCGCLKKRTPHNATHKLSRENLYHIWETMRLRCTSPKNKRYYLYGARGISVCPEWFNNFLAFREWALTNGYRKGLSLDRINSNGNYEPSNCRWVTVKEQQNNRRITKKATINGITKPVALWCDDYGIRLKTVLERIRTRGMTPEEAILTPIAKKKHR